ncbi:FHA domain containing protein [Entamoeba histolytica HM-1:IMSS-B]|uniref:FHA domain containing protein n=6 Tax=Entamoeba histolytica TaxID=5759 RepID=C4LV17_ENTH1|nr:hypothetical protein EHI_092550 [Entamoeba histolytica HM-1:IMSS]EMD46439.1 FHA domain containing protein [Entamoeba histolytica KU27]EMH72696.1 FHA domain containing protein [Entamoeba histolytica HM-1:IMSS-B]EMS16876.1 FHA domain containing protein [Entamoeba histolytica HM-3:IMSS]ENY63896.1 FHA domain containing protein [Entamoeba histolytica HM-1:IMSS-A]GAT92488.1 hypothetical protein CL6EHI_092550 [Entamoeba histolytica]|eukprot:XP_650688.1 hypothetical protein EHI_092550 [Entamoeba histolytica HM-1:IMSS]
MNSRYTLRSSNENSNCLQKKVVLPQPIQVWLQQRKCDCYAHLIKESTDSNSNAPTLIHLFKKITTLGRQSKCDVVFDSLIHPMNISRIHAKLEMTADGVVISDLSTNGIFVNNEKVTFKTLRDGDLITLAGGKSIEIGTIFKQPSSSFNFRYEVLKKGESPTTNIDNTSDFLTSTSENCLDTVSDEYYSMNLRANTVRGNVTCPMCKKLFVVPITLSCGHTFCYTCDLEYSMKYGNCYECPICFQKARTRTKSIVIESIVDNIIKGDTQRDKSLFEERQRFARMYLLNTPTLYGKINVSKLPYGFGEWKEEQKLEVQKLMSIVSGIERENWFVALGITKFDLIHASNDIIIQTLRNLKINFNDSDDPKIKLALIFVYINTNPTIPQ